MIRFLIAAMFLCTATSVAAQTPNGAFGGMVPATGTAVGVRDTNGRLQPLRVDGTGALITAGGGAAANLSVGVNGAIAPTSSTQMGWLDGLGLLRPVSAADPLPITGSISASNPSVGVTGAAVPAQATYTGVLTGGNLVGLAQPLTDTQLRATPVPISGSVTATVASTTVTNTVATTIRKAAVAPLSTAVTVATSATALPAGTLANRVSLCVYNNSAFTIYLGAAGVTTATGLPLPAGGSFCDDVGAQVYYAVVAAGTVEARVLEN